MKRKKKNNKNINIITPSILQQDNQSAGFKDRKGKMKPNIPLKDIPKSDRPVVDPNKKDVVISLGIPMYNELIKGHLRETLDNALAVGFDHIIVLDDGSTDGSWEVLQDYANNYPQINIYKNEKNSVYDPNGINRWSVVVNKIAKTNPDWVVIRSADQIYSYRATKEGGDLFRKKLIEFYHKGVELVRIPCAHLWRSRYWYRNDNVWGRDVRFHSKAPMWRFHPKFNYDGRRVSGAHLGWHHPTSWGYGDKRRKITVNINEGGAGPNWDLIVLHLGHLTHESKCLKFEWSMKASQTNKNTGRSILMPPPENMPPVSKWMLYNGYKGFCEFQMDLREAPSIWFKEEPNYSKKPVPRSLYPVIKKYNQKRADEYRKAYIQRYGWPGDDSDFTPPPPLEPEIKKEKPPVLKFPEGEIG